jgi:hypothetical protein
MKRPDRHPDCQGDKVCLDPDVQVVRDADQPGSRFADLPYEPDLPPFSGDDPAPSLGGAAFSPPRPSLPEPPPPYRAPSSGAGSPPAEALPHPHPRTWVMPTKQNGAPKRPPTVPMEEGKPRQAAWISAASTGAPWVTETKLRNAFEAEPTKVKLGALEVSPMTILRYNLARYYLGFDGTFAELVDEVFDEFFREHVGNLAFVPRPDLLETIFPTERPLVAVGERAPAWNNGQGIPSEDLTPSVLPVDADGGWE